MAFKAKTDHVGLAQTGLEIVANSDGATNQLLEIPGSSGAFLGAEKFGSVKAPHCDYKITQAIASLKLTLGKVHATGSAFALKSVNIHTGAGEEPTFAADAVEIEAGSTQTHRTYSTTLANMVTPVRHAQTFGAFTFTESVALSLQTGDYTLDCELSPTTINGSPVASDAAKAFEQVSVTMWTDDDTAEPAVTIADGWSQTADWACSGQDGGLFVWTATFKRYLAIDAD